MERRRFFAALLGGAVLDMDKLLWRPGAKLISIPAVNWVEFNQVESFREFERIWNRYQNVTGEQFRALRALEYSYRLKALSGR